MKFLPQTVRWQIAFAMGLVVAVAVLVVLAGLIAYYLIFEKYIVSQLPEITQQALAALEAGKTLTVDQLRALQKLYSIDSSTWQDNVPLVIFSALGILIGILFGSALGKRLAAPIESVASAARDLSAGDLNARAVYSGKSRGETRQLVQNFNSLADNLLEAERELAGSASAIAHELRTPVAIMRARLQAVHDDVLPLNKGEIAGLIGQADLLATIIDDLQDLSHTSPRKIALNCVDADLAEVVRASIPSLEVSLRQAGMKLETTLLPARANVDVVRVQQILNALISNARRYAYGGKIVTIETRSNAAGTSLAILDRGPGLPRGNTQQVFDRFWRGEPSRTRETGGTGLGLAIVKTLVEAHGGRVRAFNRDGGGAGIELLFSDQ